jgi:peptidoglycan hydrolase-like protein with peptidoglycan-binding domain
MGEEGTLIELEELAPVEIIDLQERLQALKLYDAKIDGIPGARTRQALREYFLKQAGFASRGKLDASALDLFDVAPAGRAGGL